ncbi:hypothetical protein K458DRAFT_167127 [Lentithecium fluviatile CBS 122367]|uniref:PCI domain-containing protein n=1 Tax=Lentithecium fluviatile CBS 122367 TaxID=1168545 RepID=A0A6G1JAL1_9PLEO|nr:hypothetical protein K458DRAFT_167127 [Lentithecium fluviatile CBS 122367]
MAPLLTQVCSEVNGALQRRDGVFLASILAIEPPFTPIYEQLIVGLRATYPANTNDAIGRLERDIRAIVGETEESEDADGRPVPRWGAMVTFLASWMAFIRDVDVLNLLKTYEDLSELIQRGNAALQHTPKGVLLLPTLVGYAKIFARIAVGVEKRPELIQHLLGPVNQEGGRESLAEKAANVVRQCFITCLSDKATAPGGIRNSKPDGKKAGVYKMANICLKILFQSDKLDNCTAIFRNINNSAPPLHFYPASERVTYLYYLGRHLFANTDFYQAQLVLQKAYDDCTSDPRCRHQKSLILVYLVSANMILGRFPTEHIYSQPEAYGFRKIFSPIAQAIRRGDIESFRRLTSMNVTSKDAVLLRKFRVFYQIGHYCEVLIWRSLFRKVFLLTGHKGTTEKSAPTLDLNAVLAAFQYLEKRAIMTPAIARAEFGPGRRPATFAPEDFMASTYIDPDFEGVEDAKPYNHMPDIAEVECICSSLITQGFLNGFISHKMNRFAIQGARKVGSASKAGFPNAWEVIKATNVEAGQNEVEGWVKEIRQQGGPNVIRLASARPAGS